MCYTLAKKLKHKVATRMKKSWTSFHVQRIHLAISLRNCFLSLLAVMVFHISLSMNLKIVSVVGQGCCARHCFFVSKDDIRSIEPPILNREGASHELPCIQERSSDQLVNIVAGGLRCWDAKAPDPSVVVASQEQMISNFIISTALL